MRGRRGAGPSQGEAVTLDRMPADPDLAEQIWLIDGFNVMQVGGLTRGEGAPAQWWSAEARQRLLDEVAPLSSAGNPTTVVFDGPHPGEEHDEPTAPRVVFARSADDWIARTVRDATDPDTLCVVTADRSLSGRCRHRGARVVSPRDFLARCRGVDLGVSAGGERPPSEAR